MHCWPKLSCCRVRCLQPGPDLNDQWTLSWSYDQNGFAVHKRPSKHRHIAIVKDKKRNIASSPWQKIQNKPSIDKHPPFVCELERLLSVSGNQSPWRTVLPSIPAQQMDQNPPHLSVTICYQCKKEHSRGLHLSQAAIRERIFGLVVLAYGMVEI